MFCLSYQYDLKQTEKFSLDKFFKNIMVQKFAKLSSINVFYFVSSYPTLDNLVFTTYTYYIHYAKRKIELDKDTSATRYLYEKKHLLKVFPFYMEIFVTFDPSVVRIVIIFTLYVSDMKLENFT